DTPGHADFGGEVERALSMADGALLLVDASEGPLPQTRFVLEKTFKAGLKTIVVINKIDRPDARIDAVLNEIYDLFIDLDASEEQLDFPLIYAIGRDGIAQMSMEEEGKNLHVLFDMIIEKIPAPSHIQDEPFQMLVADLDYSDYMGRLAVGKIFNGRVSSNDKLVCIGENNQKTPLKVSKIQVYDGVLLKDADIVDAGEIIILSGIEDVKIGDTICNKEFPKALKRITVDEPTVSMVFCMNKSPFSGREGKIVQASKIRERLLKESLRNVAIHVEDSPEKDSFIVKGRGEFQMAIIVETMRREGFELCIGRPEVIYKYEDGKKVEPIERLFVDCDENYIGIVTEKLSSRKGKMVNLINHGKGRVRIEFSIPSRSMIGYRDEFLTDTKGTGIMNSYLSGYEAFRGEFPTRSTGSLVSDREGTGVPYALFNLEPRGRLFIEPGTPVYEGMVIGEHNKNGDLDINPTKEKKLSNVRASGRDEHVTLSPVRKMTLETAINYINEDEMIEVTPKSIRLRKVIFSAHARHQHKGTTRKKKTT
ncbi:translational GTPase TypA, partial [bacterium]|nr:translational GTPase TypA [bacterium]